MQECVGCGVLFGRWDGTVSTRCSECLMVKGKELLDAHNDLRADNAALRARLALLERVREAAEARMENWTRETYVALRAALDDAKETNTDG